MTDLVTKYKSRTYRDIEWSLREQQTPDEIIQQTLAELRKARAEAKSAKLSRRRNDTAWAEIIEALQHERRIVRSMLRYKPKEPTPERDEFVQGYAHALNTLHARLTTLKKEGKPPAHSHWVDFVPGKIKDAFTEAVNAIPAKAKARVKQPFERRLPYLIHDRRKGRLLRATRSELTTAQATNDHDKIARLTKAIELIHAIPLGDHIPNTWHEVMRETRELG